MQGGGQRRLTPKNILRDTNRCPAHLRPPVNAGRGAPTTEVGNIVLNGVMGSVSNVLKKRLIYSIPVYIEETVEHLLREDDLNADSTIISAKTELTVKKLQIKGDIILLFRVNLFNTLIETLNTM